MLKHQKKHENGCFCMDCRILAKTAKRKQNRQKISQEKGKEATIVGTILGGKPNKRPSGRTIAQQAAKHHVFRGEEPNTWTDTGTDTDTDDESSLQILEKSLITILEKVEKNEKEERFSISQKKSTIFIHPIPPMYTYIIMITLPQELNCVDDIDEFSVVCKITTKEKEFICVGFDAVISMLNTILDDL